MDPKVPAPDDKGGIKKLELPPDFDEERKQGGSKKPIIIAAIVAVVVVVLALYFSGVFDGQQQRPQERSIKFH